MVIVARAIFAAKWKAETGSYLKEEKNKLTEWQN